MLTSNETFSYRHFLQGLLHNPRGVSAPTPSSPTLAKAIASHVDPSRDGFVIELGPGTGVVTGALLERGIAPSRLIAIEQEDYFVDLMRARFPSVTIRQGDALQFEDYVPRGARIAAVVSGLPLLQLSAKAGQSLLHRAMRCQQEKALFIQLSYSWRPPVTAPEGIEISKQTVWRNFPPAHVWTYQCIQNGD